MPTRSPLHRSATRGDAAAPSRAPARKGLTHHRWAIGVLAELHRGQGARFATLVARLQASRGGVRQSLEYLIETGFVRRNPGFGHPLRPEYLLTKRGEAPGAAAHALLKHATRAGVMETVRSKWTLPILEQLSEHEARFAGLQRGLPDATDRALSLGLKGMMVAQLVERAVEPTSPPRVTYRLTRRGVRLWSYAAALAVGERSGG